MEDVFFVILTYQGNEYTVEVEDPTNSIQELINKIVVGLGLPRINGYGTPFPYFLGRELNDDWQVLEPEVNGEGKNLIDYQVKPGDRLTLTARLMGCCDC